MPLEGLIAEIERIKTRLHTHRETLRENETRTRMTLIDPMLTALGWDTTDPSQILPEYITAGKQRADYALFGSETDPKGKPRPIALLEAKKLGASSTKYHEQVFSYSVARGIPYAGLTDGNSWELYNLFERKELEERCILQVSLADDPADTIALRMLVLWRPHLQSESGTIEMTGSPILTPPVITETPKTKAIKVVRRVPIPTHPGTAPTKKVKSIKLLQKRKYDPLSDISLSDIADNKVVKGNPAPMLIEMPDKSEYPTKSWKDILTLTAAWLYRKIGVNEKNSQIEITKKRYLVNTIAKHPTGKIFTSPEPIQGTSLYAETNWSADNLMRYTKTLVEVLGENPRDIYIRFGR